MITADVAVVGGGIAGASLAAEIAGHASVVLIEAEDQPGTHATGRSAAFWTETYGGPGVQPLTSASGPWLASPPETFALHGFLSPRCALHLAQDTATVRLRDLTAAFPDVELLPLSEEQVRARVPG